MRKQVVQRLLTVCVVIAVSVGLAGADVLTFEEITTGTNDTSVPNGYGGFSWWKLIGSGYSPLTLIYGNKYPNTGFQQCVTATNSLYCTMSGGINASTTQITRPDERVFNFEGAWFSAAFSGPDATLWLLGSYHGESKYSFSVTINSTSAVWVECNFEGIDQLKVSCSKEFAMDNFSYSLPPVVYPRGEVVVDFDDLYMGGSESKYLPLGFKGILWDEDLRVMSEINFQNRYGYAYANPHSWDKYIFNFGQDYAELSFSFDPAVYPEAVLLGAWFSRAISSQTVGANEVRFMAYDANSQVIAATDWLTLTDMPQYLEAIDAATGEPFGYAARIEVEYTTSDPTGFGKYAMDDVTFQSDPVVVPIANPGGPYMAGATDWDGGPATLDGSASEALGQATIVAYAWDLDTACDSDGDGEPANDFDEPNAIVTAEFPLGQTGVALVVTDSNGKVSEPVLTTVTISSITVTIDIKPGSDDNIVVMNSKGSLPVAFLTDASFDATSIDPTTVTLRGRDFADGLLKVSGKKKQKPMVKLTDVDDDGDIDLVAHLDIEKVAAGDVQTECEIGGLTYDGYVVSGTDTINIIQR